jgi:integrase
MRQSIFSIFLSLGLPDLNGLRIGEILALRWKDADFTSSEIRVEQACHRGLIGTPKTKGSRRTLPMPKSLEGELKRLSEKSTSQEQLVFHTPNGTPFSDTNLLHQYLKPVGRKLGMPWLNWHTLAGAPMQRSYSTQGRRSERHRHRWVTPRCQPLSKFTQ